MKVSLNHTKIESQQYKLEKFKPIEKKQFINGRKRNQIILCNNDIDC